MGQCEIEIVEVSDASSFRPLLQRAFETSTEADLAEGLLADGDSAFALGALRDGAPAGYIQLSKVHAPFPSLGLAPLAVAEEERGNGLGSKLLMKAIEWSARNGWHAIFVLGEPDFYTRYGFDVDAAQSYQCTYRGPYFMVRNLIPNRPLPLGGEIRYAAAFDRLA